MTFTIYFLPLWQWVVSNSAVTTTPVSLFPISTLYKHNCRKSPITGRVHGSEWNHTSRSKQQKRLWTQYAPFTDYSNEWKRYIPRLLYLPEEVMKMRITFSQYATVTRTTSKLIAFLHYATITWTMSMRIIFLHYATVTRTTVMRIIYFRCACDK